MKHLDIEVIAVNPMNSSLHLPDNKLMKEFMKRHYPKVKYTILKGWAEDEIIRYLHQISEDVLVVMGAYQRSTVSRWFRESMADILMKEVKFPLFIAHNK
jgi:nucleotide-binding universal stress UspA family protein